MAEAPTQSEHSTRHSLASIQNLDGAKWLLQEYYRLPEPSDKECTEGRTGRSIYWNRYKNVLPADFARVVKERTCANETDYFNGSWLPLGLGEDKAAATPGYFIATQAPFARTIDDFWHIVWQYDVRTVVLLGDVTGDGKIIRYWPSTSATGKDGEKSFDYDTLNERYVIPYDEGRRIVTDTMMLRAEDKIRHADGAILERVLTLRENEEGRSGGASKKAERVVRHFQLCDWPDHGVPERTETLRALVSLARESQRKAGEADGAHHPLLVHCSAGIGRTGVFCVVYSVTQHLEEVRSAGVDVFSLVCEYRRRRPGMVQTEMQYEFCFRAIRDEANAMGLSLSSSSGHKRPLDTPDSASDGSEGRKTPKMHESKQGREGSGEESNHESSGTKKS